MYYLFKGQTSKNGHEPRLKKNLLMRKSTFFKWFYFSKMNQTSFHFLLTKDIDVSDNSVFLTFFSSCMLWFLSICLKICNHYYYYLVLFKFISLAYYTCPRPIYIYRQTGHRNWYYMVTVNFLHQVIFYYETDSQHKVLILMSMLFISTNTLSLILSMLLPWTV